MSIFRIILVHLKGRRIKTAFLGIALSLGVATVIAMISLVFAMRLELGNELDKFGPNIVIMPRFQGQTLASEGGGLGQVSAELKPLTPEDIDKIKTISDRESLNIISPKLVGPAKINGQPALLVGMDTESEFKMKPWFSFHELVGANPGGVETKPYAVKLADTELILGFETAQGLGLSAGDAVSVNGQPYQLTGILNKSGGDEDRLIFANLSSVQSLLGYEGSYSMIEVSGFCNNCPIEDMTSQISDVLPNARVTALRQAALVREETIDRFETFGSLFSVAALLMTVLSGITTMLSSVNERTGEIGTFRAIGFRRGQILELIFGEAILISLLAGFMGYVVGTLVAKLAGPGLAQIEVMIPWDPNLLLLSMILSMGLGILSSIYPALKAANMDPVRSIRHF
ncbi:MAG: FtsX-like permease family protein [Clostridiaceae bacterium]